MHQLATKVFITIGTVIFAVTIKDIDLQLGVALKITGLISFVCFLIINKNKIIEGISGKKDKNETP